MARPAHPRSVTPPDPEQLVKYAWGTPISIALGRNWIDHRRSRSLAYGLARRRVRRRAVRLPARRARPLAQVYGVTLHYHGTPITPRPVLQSLAGRHFCVSFAAPG
jgi:hypothetical protein